MIENSADKRALIEYTKEFVLTYSSPPREQFSASFNLRERRREIQCASELSIIFERRGQNLKNIGESRVAGVWFHKCSQVKVAAS